MTRPASAQPASLLAPPADPNDAVPTPRRGRARASRRDRLRIAAALASLMWIAGCAADHDPRVTRFASLELWIGSSATPPSPDAAGWRTVHPPDFWLMERRRHADQGWYRARFHVDAGEEAWALFAPWLESNAAVYLNGALVADDGAFLTPRRPRRNLPLLVTLPRRLLEPGENLIELRLYADPASPGVLGGLYVGPLSALRRAFEWRNFLQETLPETIAAIAFVLALLMLLVYRRHDPERSVRWFAAGIGLWGVSIASAIARAPMLPLRAWQWLGTAALAGVAFCFMMGFHRVARFGRERTERAVLALLLVLGAAAALVPDLYAFAALIVWTAAIVVLAVYILRLLASVSRRREVRSAWLLRAVAVLAVAVIVHDVASALAVRPLSGLWLTGYLASGAVLYAGVSMVIDLRRALDEAECLNRELEQRVRDKHAALERNYETLRGLERERAVTDERERIMRDMHDGIGGHLVSTLSMVESGRASPGAVADALRDALEDLRLVIDSLDPVEGDLGAALGMIRHRLQPRLERSGLEIEWRVADLPPIAGFGPERVLQVVRIVQEAITNVVRHAHASRVVLETGEERATTSTGDAVFVEIRDDGQGFTVEHSARRGRGLSNMRRRADQLGGHLIVSSDATGTKVRLSIPRLRGASAE